MKKTIDHGSEAGKQKLKYIVPDCDNYSRPPTQHIVI